MANPEHLEILKKGVGVWNKWRKRCPAVGPDLSGADLSGADLSGVDFSLALKNKYVALGAVMAGMDVVDVVECGDALRADLRKARLAGARLGKANLFGADLSEADLHSADLQNAQLTAALLEEFADRLYADLQNRGVRCWFASHDMPIGARLRPTIDEWIRVYDKLLLVLSEHSVSSQWVEQEVETALAREREQEGRTVLFPVRIDDAIMESKAGWPALLKNTRNVGDFTRWKDHDSYRKAFDRLLRDLKAEGREASV